MMLRIDTAWKEFDNYENSASYLIEIFELDQVLNICWLNLKSKAKSSCVLLCIGLGNKKTNCCYAINSKQRDSSHYKWPFKSRFYLSSGNDSNLKLAVTIVFFGALQDTKFMK